MMGQGWQRAGGSGKTLFIGELPMRKQTCLYVLDGSVIRPLAFFKDDAKAREAMEMMTELALGRGDNRPLWGDVQQGGDVP